MRSSGAELKAVGLALASYTCWVLADTSLKIMGASALPVFEVVALVGLAIVGITVGYALCGPGMGSLRPKDPVRQTLRSSLDVLNNVFVVIALRHLPLALFYILVFAAPLVTALLGAVVLGERLDLKKSIALLTGFAGVVVAVNPFGMSRPGDWTGYLACLVCVSAFSANMVWSRQMTQTESSESLTFSSGALMAVVGGTGMLHDAVRVTAPMAGVVVATGAFCVVGSLCFFAALRHAPAATVAQYHYSQLLTGAVIAYAIWRERPTAAMIAGAGLIVAAGWYTARQAYRERGAGVPEPAGIP